MKEQWRKELQDKMSDYGQAVPPVSWDAIEKAVADSRRPARARRLSLWVRLGAAAAVVALMGVAVGLLWQSPADEAPVALSKVTGTALEADEHGARQETTMAGEAAQAPSKAVPLMADAAPVSRRLVHRGLQPMAEASVVSSAEVPSVAVASSADGEQKQEAAGQTPSPVEAATAKTAPRQTAVGHPSEAQSLWDDDTSAAPRPRRRHPLLAQVSLSNGFDRMSSTYNEPLCFSDANMSQNTFAASTDEIVRPVETFRHAVSEHADHRMPLRFGLSLSYGLSERWSLSSGVTYSLLSADVTRDTGGHEEQLSQTLHYVGIPLHVNYQLWASPRLQFYVVAGGMVEKMVGGKRSLKSGVNYEPLDKCSETVHVRPLQVSVDGGLGAEYLFDKQFGVYVEPTVGYAFDNGSKVPTYYQDHPFSWGLTLGLRMHLGGK